MPFLFTEVTNMDDKERNDEIKIEDLTEEMLEELSNGKGDDDDE